MIMMINFLFLLLFFFVEKSYFVDKLKKNAVNFIPNQSFMTRLRIRLRSFKFGCQGPDRILGIFPTKGYSQ